MAEKLNHAFSRGHDYVQIGNTKWATMNVGAKTITDVGLYFAWGEHKGYNCDDKPIDNKQFDWPHYKFGQYNQLTKYNDELGPTTLQLQDDAAHVNWRGGWRMPTNGEFKMLILSTTQEWVNNYQNSGVNGVLITDMTNIGNKLFFPAAGYGYGNGFGECNNRNGFYWSSSLKLGENYQNAHNIYFDSNYRPTPGFAHNPRFVGFPIRAVLGD